MPSTLGMWEPVRKAWPPELGKQITGLRPRSPPPPGEALTAAVGHSTPSITVATWRLGAFHTDK